MTAYPWNLCSESWCFLVANMTYERFCSRYNQVILWYFELPLTPQSLLQSQFICLLPVTLQFNQSALLSTVQQCFLLSIQHISSAPMRILRNESQMWWCQLLSVTLKLCSMRLWCESRGKVCGKSELSLRLKLEMQHAYRSVISVQTDDGDHEVSSYKKLANPPFTSK